VSKERSHAGEFVDMAAATSHGLWRATADATDSEKDTDKKSKVSVATQLVQLVEADYELGCTPDGEPYAIPNDGPQIVRQLRGGRGSLRAELASKFYAEHGMAPSQTALADACMVLEGKAQHVDHPVDLHLRVAEHEGALFLDLGDQLGRCVEITPEWWKVIDPPPVRFRRTALTGALPEPVGGHNFDALWSAVNFKTEYQPVVLAVLVSNLMPNMPHPVVLIGGEHGTGKTTASRRIASIVDASPVGPRKAPRDVESWTTAAAGSWVVALDNLSGIPDWLSDALCRASTGDGDVRRRLYTDGDLHVIAFRRALIVNGIDVGAMRGDLADRLVHLLLERIPDTKRRRDEEMTQEWNEAHPKILGALLDLTVKVLAELPTITLDTMPRMADFARVLAAVDRVNKTDGLTTYLGLRRELAEDVASSDPVIIALTESVSGEFTGTSATLLELIYPLDDAGQRVDPRRLPKDWPDNARELTAALNRHAPVLRQLGWTVAKSDRKSGRQVQWELTPPPDEQREAEKRAHDARMREEGASSQVNDGTQGCASDRASAAHQDDDAHGAHQDQACAADAQGNAHTTKPHLTSANKDHRASSASSAPNTGFLCPSCQKTTYFSPLNGVCRRCNSDRKAS
jgi:hypothetical protein